ncbi:MAG: dihydroorotate dehydrogenase [Nitrospirota bacterium]|nr:dihydroorotate dehydrogenase [Nitrospirota bacterium]
MKAHPTYDIERSYEDNYKEGPFLDITPPQRTVTPEHSFLDFQVNSLLGMPAGPLLNANWVIAYAKLGFDLLVYKTVRTEERPCHPNPNCMYLSQKRQLREIDFNRQLIGSMTPPDDASKISITNSFGMPSRAPEIWQADIQKAKAGLGQGQLLIVSVVGTAGEMDLKSDYVRGAALAVEAGAPVIEINLSCPNVVSREGSIFTDADFSSQISKAVKQEIGEIPLIIKMGYIADPFKRALVISGNAPHVDAISSINTLSFEVIDEEGEQALPGEGRLRSGVCGAAIRACALSQAKHLVALKKQHHYDFSIIGVGGIMTTEHIHSYLDAGVNAVMSATGAMWDPLLAYRYWEESLSLT